MNLSSTHHLVSGVIVGDKAELLGFDEFCRACGMTPQDMIAWIDEGIVEAEGDGPPDWRFGGTALRRARTASRLSRDLQVGLDALGLVLDLLDEIDSLKAKLRRAGAA
ncbi:MAG TPA: chaperone modulator CbpM [Rhizobacter sp.]|nr:chaperone modulator CbpM [Rhizobacter sp.]